MSYNLSIPCASGIEATVKRQLEKLGYFDCKALDGRISLVGNDYDIARLNINLAAAERVLIVIGSVKAETFDELYDNIKALGWGDILSADAKVLTYAKSSDSKLFALKSICSVAKKAVVDSLYAHYHTDLSQTGERAQIEIAIHNDIATVSLDASGDGLYKRGYRTLAYTAPLKETTASALLDLSYYNPEKQFADLFCGSGTLPIEAALRSCNMAVGLNRDFDFAHFKFIDQKALENAKIEAKDKIKVPQNFQRITATDISKEAISIARYHAKCAGVEQYIHFQAADFREFATKNNYGVMISNIPYGERMGEEKEIAEIHKGLKDLYRKLPRWNMYILTTAKNLERVFGRKADKKRKLYNANLECCYYSFLSPKPTKPKNAQPNTD